MSTLNIQAIEAQVARNNKISLRDSFKEEVADKGVDLMAEMLAGKQLRSSREVKPVGSQPNFALRFESLAAEASRAKEREEEKRLADLRIQAEKDLAAKAIIAAQKNEQRVQRLADANEFVRLGNERAYMARDEREGLMAQLRGLSTEAKAMTDAIKILRANKKWDALTLAQDALATTHGEMGKLRAILYPQDTSVSLGSKPVESKKVIVADASILLAQAEKVVVSQKAPKSQAWLERQAAQLSGKMYPQGKKQNGSKKGK